MHVIRSKRWRNIIFGMVWYKDLFSMEWHELCEFFSLQFAIINRARVTYGYFELFPVWSRFWCGVRPSPGFETFTCLTNNFNQLINRLPKHVQNVSAKYGFKHFNLSSVHTIALCPKAPLYLIRKTHTSVMYVKVQRFQIGMKQHDWIAFKSNTLQPLVWTTDLLNF